MGRVGRVRQHPGLEQRRGSLLALPVWNEVGGNATLENGDPVDRVVIRQWETNAFVDEVIPDENGDWAILLRPGDYDITYFADGCQPICHGPYTVT